MGATPGDAGSRRVAAGEHRRAEAEERQRVEDDLRRVEAGTDEAVAAPWLQRLGRSGLFARGVIYLLIAWLAIEVALGDSGAEADRSGALHAVARQPFGRVTLVALSAGFGGYALWQAACAVAGRRAGKNGSAPPAERLLSLGTALVYSGICVSTVGFVVGASDGGGDQQSQDWTARVMQAPLGRYVTGGVGIAVAAVGLVLLWRALHRHLDVDLSPGCGPDTRDAVVTLGVIGLSARALVVTAVGVLLFDAAATFRPQDARGLDGALKALAGLPYGKVLLGLMALGLLAYGLYSVAAARYADL